MNLIKQAESLVKGDKTELVSDASEDDEEQENKNRKYVEGIRNYIQKHLDDKSETQIEEEKDNAPRRS